MESTTLFIPDGYGTGTIVRDHDGHPWIVGERVTARLYNVHETTDEIARTLLDQGAKLLVSTHS